MPTENRIQRFKDVLGRRQRDLTVVCENIHDPHNVSAILRSCDAVGISDIYLLYYIEALPKLARRSSGSARKWIDTHPFDDPQKLKEHLKAQGFRIYATFIEPKAKSIYEVDWTNPCAIVMGNEHRGVSRELMEIADETVYIPMMGMVESLNVSVATAVTLFEASRQRNANNMYPEKKVTNDWYEKKLQEWIAEK